MKRISRAVGCVAALVLGFAADSPGATWPFPLLETEHILTRWLESSGFQVRRESRDPSSLRLDAKKQEERWTLLLQSQSPLSTEVSSAPGEPPSSARDQALSDVLSQRLRGAATLADDRLPPAVLSRKQSVVCIRADVHGEKLQLSGFAIDGKGTILTTAHGLEGVSTVTVRLADGREFPARIMRFDKGHDLALAVSPMATKGAVDLRNARLTLDEGERVYAIGCPDGGEETVRSGVAHTHMRRVESLVLWEVEMETRPGGSGSPMFDASGRLVGVVKGRFRGDDTRALVIPAETVVRFWKSR